MAKTAIRFILKGVKELERKFKLEEKIAEKAGSAGIYGLGNNIMTDSKRRVPVDLGALRGSGYVTLPEKKGKEVSVEIGYGGPAEAYAVVQHEDTSLSHPEGGEHKYLLNAINARRGKAARIVNNIARRAYASASRSVNATNKGHPKDPDTGGLMPRRKKKK